MFEGPAWLVSQFYVLTHNYAVAIALVAFTVMVLVTPLTLKSTKGMLEMQRLQPEMKKLQAEYKNDRQKLNEEMMKLYQEHKVNPLASCLPLLLQMPIFFIMYRVLRGLSRPSFFADKAACDASDFCKDNAIPVGKIVFNPDHISKTSELYHSLVPKGGKNEMLAFGLDLSKSPAHFISSSFGKGMIYAALVVVLGVLYFVQQKMVASRAAVSPTMSAGQAKMMQYLPVVFAVFQIFFLTGLVIYYITQAIFRIGQNVYITKRFYGGEESLGHQAQAAGERAREEAKKNGGAAAGTGGGMFAQAKRDAQAKREALEAAKKPAPQTSKRVTPPKNKPTPSSGRPQRPTASGRPGAPARPKPPKK